MRATHVERRYFTEIDDTFAFEACEAERTLAWWLTAHWQDFAEREGFQVGERAIVFLEHFELVWPAG